MDDFGRPPVDTAFFENLIRSPVDAVPVLISGLSTSARARLALFCYARSHFRELGLMVARACDESIMIHEAGMAGRALYQHARAEDGQSKAGAKLVGLSSIRIRLVSGSNLGDQFGATLCDRVDVVR